jgi:DNA-directed RNA polymerase subunit K/omega
MDLEPQFEDDAVFDEDYIEDQEQQTQDDLDLSEFNDDLDTDVLGDLVEQESNIRQALTSSSVSVLGRGKFNTDDGTLTTDPNNPNPYNFPQFRTRNSLTKYEKTAALGVRAEQLRRGAHPYVDLEIKDADGKVIRVVNDEEEMAKMELGQGVLPLNFDRPIPSNTTNRPTYQTVSLKTLIHSTNPNF